jgi:D-amino peptidase
MKVLVFTDMEGVSGVYSYRQVIKEFGEPFEEGRKLLVSDINAAIEGLAEAGATEFVVADSHRRGLPPNVIDDALARGATVIRGSEISKFSYSGVAAQVLIGFHSMAGTGDGFLSHTMSSLLGFAVSVNGKWVGEAELEVWKAAHQGVPTIMAAGDSALSSEIKSFFPDITAVSVKASSSRTQTRCFDVKDSRNEIFRTAADALNRLSTFEIHTPGGPFRLVIAFKSEELADWAANMPRAKRIHPRAISYEAEDWDEARSAYHTAYHLGFRVVDPGVARIEKDERVRELREQAVRKAIRERWEQPAEPLPEIP